LCGLSQTEGWLIFSRSLQGIGGALMIPATQGIIMTHFAPHQRGKAIGLFVSIGSIFLSLGPLIGGSLTEYFSWHYVFWINLPIAAIGLLLTLRSTPPSKGHKGKFDFLGFLTLVIGVTALIVALMQAQHWGWSSPLTLSLLAVGVAFLILLYQLRLRKSEHIIDFNLGKQRSFIGGSGCIFITQFALMVTVFWAIYFQNILHYSPSQAGVLAFLSNFPVILGAPLAGFLVDRLGPRIPVVIGYSLMAISIAFLLCFENNENTWLLILTLIPFGLGSPMTFTPSSVTMYADVPLEKRGIASGMNAALRQFSATLGLALFGTLFSTVQTSQMSKELALSPDTATLNVAQMDTLLSNTPQAVKEVHALSPIDAAYVYQVAERAFISGFFWINLVSMLALIAGVYFACRLLKNRPLHRD
ncbi:MAG: MFS transporter, partial [Chlamydiota bacterium]